MDEIPQLISVESGGIKFLFDQGLWQAKKITEQLGLYDELLGSPNKRIEELEASALRTVHHTRATNPHRKLLIRRLVKLSDHGPKSFAIDPPPTGETVRTSSSVVPYESPENSPSRWVRYPTQYSFFAYGEVQRQGLFFTAAEAALEVLDRHIDDFMAERKKRRKLLEEAVLAISPEVVPGKKVKDLSPLLQEVVTRSFAALKSGNEDLSGLTIESVTTEIYLEEQTGEGTLLDIEVP